MFVWIIVFVANLSILGAGIYLLRARRERAPAEEGKTPLWTEAVGARIRIVSYTYPLVELRCYDEMLVLSGLSTAVVPFDEVEGIEVTRKPTLWETVKISLAGGERYWIFSTNSDRLLEELRHRVEEVSGAAET